MITLNNFAKMVILFFFFIFSNLVFAQFTYEDGQNAARRLDFKQAFTIFSELSQQGDLDATQVLGLLYAHGYGTAKDVKKAETIYQSLARNGDLLAQEKLCVEYSGHKTSFFPKEKKPEIEPEKAYEFCLMGALNGGPIAQISLARLYFPLHKAPQLTKAQALYWAEKAAEANYPPALYWTGVSHLGTYGIPDMDKVNEYIWKAAEYGNKNAEIFLCIGRNRFLGETNFSEHYFWCSIALKGIPPRAISYEATLQVLNTAISHLTIKQRQELDDRIKNRKTLKWVHPKIEEDLLLGSFWEREEE